MKHYDYEIMNFPQVTLEEQMICGALQTLNEEACEDVLEETEDTTIIIDPEVPQTSVIPPSPESTQGESKNHAVITKCIQIMYPSYFQ
ncbi:hypothetical protein NQ314_019187 [Rhamnusium bicolor]|uniref:Uncharacterized protein n=1 Tax=Rhamnusium bicolor TaxID=1586634 RepID=A0AAV8WPM1_9CUCU|nr:hypothetical protein NQ314_019187 [Rhamnusium bicolor]